MSRHRCSLRMVPRLFTFPIAVSVFCLFFAPTAAFSEEIQGKASEEVEKLLKQLARNEKPIEASKALYKMGPEIDKILLEKLKTMTLAQASDPANGVAGTIATILSSRGYDKDILTILKSRLSDSDSENRIAAAIMLTSIYLHFPLQDLSSIVSNEKDPGYLNEQIICQSRMFFPTVEEILRLLNTDSNASKDLALALLRIGGMDCLECGYSVEKWKAFLESDKEAVKFFRSIKSLFKHQEHDGNIPDGIGTITASPDGKMIAFVAEFRPSEDSRDTNLWIMNTSTDKITKVQIPGTCYAPSWSPKGDRILFENRSSKGYNICTIEENGSEFSIWTKSFNAMNNRARWHPDASKIIFIKGYFLPMAKEIQVIDLLNNIVKSAARDNFCNLLRPRLYPLWCLSDRGDLFFWDCHGDDKETAGLYATSVADPGKTRLLQAFDLDKSYDCLIVSPDQTKIAYTKDYGDLFVYDLETNVAEQSGINYTSSFPVWTPDGKAILFASSYQETGETTYLFSPETGESTRLANGYSYSNAFGPGGRSIYYTKWVEEAKQSSIWRINLDGTNDTKIFPVEGIEYTSVTPTPILKWAERN